MTAQFPVGEPHGIARARRGRLGFSFESDSAPASRPCQRASCAKLQLLAFGSMLFPRRSEPFYRRAWFNVCGVSGSMSAASRKERADKGTSGFEYASGGVRRASETSRPDSIRRSRRARPWCRPHWNSPKCRSDAVRTIFVLFP
jgi:hypothetical protein